jgi:ribose 5-phosphate isomerase B
VKIALGSDHAGFQFKEKLKSVIILLGHTFEDFGTHTQTSCDYPDYAEPVARAVASAKCDRGILICGTGIGMSISANKVRGIRAALCCDVQSARMSREHNNANVLCLGARASEFEAASEIVKVWLLTEFAAGRHEQRVKKITAIEEKENRSRQK